MWNQSVRMEPKMLRNQVARKAVEDVVAVLKERKEESVRNARNGSEGRRN